MQSHINLLLLACLAVFTSVGFAQKAVSLPDEPVSDGLFHDGEETVLSFPYIAEITGDDVYIRSGPGTNYYRCGKLNKADRVKVIGSQFSWTRIVPPVGSFSWISKQYVSIDPNNPAIGIVTGDAVRVYAGSDKLKPIHSTTLQLKFNKGDRVKLMGEEREGYYKIVPPTGAYLWISTKYTKQLGPAGQVSLAVEPKTKADTKAKTDIIAVVPTKISVEAQALEEYYALEKQIESERTKPVAQQNYVNIKKALTEISSNKNAGKAARYAGFAIKQVERLKLALEVTKAVQLQNTQLQQVQERIDKARAARLAKIRDLGRFAVIGKLQTSNVYGSEKELKHYRITDDSGKTICYALPADSASKMDLSKFIDSRVGLIGTIEPHPQTAGALVRFTEIAKLDE